MKKMLYIIGLPTVFSMLAFAGSWSGRLLDASCYDQEKKTDGCAATSGTKAFALDAMGKVFKLDAAGNTKAAEAIKNRADRSADPANPQPKEVQAQVTGSEKDGTIAVESIDVR
jgi:hypothetical protein